MSQMNPEISAPMAYNLPPSVNQKISYGEFLRRYDGQYAEYIDGEVIKPMSLTEKHDFLTNFLMSVLTFYVSANSLGRICSEPYQMKLLIDDKIRGREPDIFSSKRKTSTASARNFLTARLI